MSLAELALGAIALAVLVPAVVLFWQVISAAGRSTSPVAARRDVTRPRLAVLIPAHDEAVVITSTLQRIVAQLAPNDRVLVVADNCTDETARLAACVTGVEVIERHNHDRRGKSHALEFGIQHLSDDAPQVVIVVDADCVVADETIDRLACECQYTGRPVQALYLMRAQKAEGLAGTVAEFAWIVKNWVRPLGMRNWGLPVQLMGSGTAFPWSILAQVKVGNLEMAEDYQLGIDLALAGHPPAFLPEAMVSSEFPVARAAELSQRTRWEHGHLQLILRTAPRLIARAASARDWGLLCLTLDLLVPPLALLGLILCAVLCVALVSTLLGGAILPLLVSGTAVFLYGAAIAVSWQGWGSERLASLSLSEVARYVLAKLPIYLHFVGRRQRVWIKTARDADNQRGETLVNKSSK
jgi:cellulose synthase/poly-beta-1,6-N-acetylglucosamine synthase-like glycosyltransferase